MDEIKKVKNNRKMYFQFALLQYERVTEEPCYEKYLN